jgi:hypothetical protein
MMANTVVFGRDFLRGYYHSFEAKAKLIRPDPQKEIENSNGQQDARSDPDNQDHIKEFSCSSRSSRRLTFR